MREAPKLLPLGSAVRVADDDGVYVVIARGFQKSGDGFLAGYKGVRHPVGAGADAREIVIREAEIAKVLHRGYEDADDVPFAKKQLEAAKAPHAKLPAVPEPDLTIDLSKPGSSGPATATAGAPSQGGAVMDPKDPFSGLRKKGKRK